MNKYFQTKYAFTSAGEFTSAIGCLLCVCFPWSYAKDFYGNHCLLKSFFKVWHNVGLYLCPRTYESDVNIHFSKDKCTQCVNQLIFTNTTHRIILYMSWDMKKLVC